MIYMQTITNIKTIRSNIKHLPETVKYLMVSTFIFVLWRWLGSDIFLSIYIEQIIDKIWIVGVLGAILAATKLLLSIPIGYLNDKTNPKYILIIAKLMYIICGLCYFAAGILESPELLIIGIVLNGLASPILFTTTMSIVREETDNTQATQAFGLFQTATQWSYFVWAIIISFFVDSIPLYYVFLAIVVFSFISMLRTTTIPIQEERGLWKTIDAYIFHQNVYKKVRQDLKEYNITLYLTLFLQFLYGIVDYLWFLFIPLLALSNDLTLWQIALIFAIMRIPHLLSVYFAGTLDKYNQFIVVCTTYITIGLFLWWLAYTKAFVGILALSLCISACLAVLRPILLWFIGRLVENRHKAEITWVQETVTRTGEIVGSIWFALIAQYSTIQRWFFIVWVLLILIAIGTLLQQHLFILPTRNIGTSIRHTAVNIFTTLKEYTRR